MAGAGAQLDRPVGPGHGAVFFHRGLGHDFELGHAGRAVAVAGAHAVGAGVATADDDDVLAIRAQLALELVAGIDLVLLGQELHGEMDPVQITTGHGQIARLLGATGQQHGVKVFLQLGGGNTLLGPVGDLGPLGQLADQHACANRHTFLDQLVHPAVNVGLLHLEVGDAIAQQAAHAVVLFKQCHAVPGARQLLGGCHTSWAGAHHGNGLAGLHFGRLRQHPAFGPAAVDDGVLDGLDAHGLVIHIQRAGCLAGCGANAAGELGEVVGAVQGVEGGLPVATVHQIVEVWNDVIDRAAVVAERCAAVHAARRLFVGLGIVQTDHELFVVFQALGNGLVALFDALVFHEASDFSHDSSFLLSSSCFFFCSSLRRFGEGCSRFLCMNLAQGTLVLVGEDLDELGA